MQCLKKLILLLLSSAIICFSLSGRTADHREAPQLSLTPQADITDVYAFIGTKYNDSQQQMLNVLVQIMPYSEAGAGPVYDRFPDDIRFNIHITDPNTAAHKISYRFRFSDIDPLTTPGLKNPDTILSYGIGANGTTPGGLSSADDPLRNYSQFYTVTKVVGNNSSVIGSDLLTAPPNLGSNITPLYNDVNGAAISGAQTFNQLDQYTRDAVHELSSGEVVFAGPREDGFYADLAGIFDLLDQRIFFPSTDYPNDLGQQGGGPDSLRGFNVNAFAIQIPLSDLNSIVSSYSVSYSGQPVSSTGLGVYASAERQRIHLLRSDGQQLKTGPWIQIERMANPLASMLFIPLKDKDNFNRSAPVNDQSFQGYILSPEIAGLFNRIHSPPLESFPTSNHTDLAGIYIPDVVRVDTTTGPVPLPGQVGFNRLSIIGADTTQGKSSGWPNGRRLADDVIDIVLTSLRTGPDSGFKIAGDNVNANDQIYHQVFPYLATPHSATNHLHR